MVPDLNGMKHCPDLQSYTSSTNFWLVCFLKPSRLYHHKLQWFKSTMFLSYSNTNLWFFVTSLAVKPYTTQLFGVFSNARHISNLPPLSGKALLVEQGSIKIYTQRLERGHPNSQTSVRFQTITFKFLPPQAMRCLLTGCFLLHIWLHGSCRSFYESHKNICVFFRPGLTRANHSALRQVLGVVCLI